jgi:hypothetical protein
MKSTIVIFLTLLLIPAYGMSQQVIGKSEISASKATIKAFPDSRADVIAIAQKGDTVTVLNESIAHYILVSLGTDTGYVELSGLKNQQLAGLAKNSDDDPVLKRLEERYDKKTALRIYHEKVWKGMTEEMLRLSLGNPQNIRRVRTSSQVKEDWIYANGKEARHIKLINGVVVSPNS